MKNILIIDDDPVILSLMKMMLPEKKYKSKTAESGCKGLEMIKNEKFDVVVTDLIMPQIEGLEVQNLSQCPAADESKQTST